MKEVLTKHLKAIDQSRNHEIPKSGVKDQNSQVVDQIKKNVLFKNLKVKV